MSANRVALRAYRALLTQTKAIRERGTDTVTVRLPVEGSWGHGQTFHGSEQYRRAVQRYLGELAQTSQAAFLTGDLEPVRVPLGSCQWDAQSASCAIALLTQRRWLSEGSATASHIGRASACADAGTVAIGDSML